MNADMLIPELSRLTRSVSRITAYASSGSAGAEIHTAGRFTQKCTDEQFLALFSDLKKPISWGVLAARAEAELGVCGRTVTRYLSRAVQGGRITRTVDPISRASLYALAPSTKSAARSPSEPAKVKKGQELVGVTIQLTQQQLAEVALFAASVGKTPEETLPALALCHLERIAEGQMDLQDEIVVFNNRFKIYRTNRKGVFTEALETGGEEAEERVEYLRSFQT